MTFKTDIKTFAALGTGVIGSGWIARALAHGWDVVALDPAPGAEAQLRARIHKCWPALVKNGLAAGASPDRLRFVDTVEACVSGADFIQESAPEVLSMKLALHARISSERRAYLHAARDWEGLDGLRDRRQMKRQTLRLNPPRP